MTNEERERANNDFQMFCENFYRELYLELDGKYDIKMAMLSAGCDIFPAIVVSRRGRDSCMMDVTNLFSECACDFAGSRTRYAKYLANKLKERYGYYDFTERED